MKRLHLVCNAHVDPVWHWTFDEGISAALATFKTACDLCDEFDYIFCHNESLLYEAVEENAPELFERIKKLVKAGKWRIIGGWYIQPDCLMPQGESLLRQIKVGHKYFQEKFGIIPEVALNFDSFGHSVGLVQILAKNGYKGYVSTRPRKRINQFPYPEGKFYRWVGPSGDSVVYANFPGYGSLLGDAAERITNQSKEADDVDGVLWGVGNHGGGPSRKDLNDIKNLKLEGFEIIHSTLDDLFRDSIRISTEIKESLVTCMAGCYSSMARVKQAHREAENVLYATEKMLAMAHLAGYNPDLTALYKAQKKLLLAEFHDILPGSCVADGENNGVELLKTCLSVAKDYRTNAFMYLTMGERVADTGEYPIYVFNPMPYEVDDFVEAELMLANQNWSLEIKNQAHVYKDGVEIPSQEIKEESNMNLDWRKRVVFRAKLAPMSVTRYSIYFKDDKYVDRFSRPMLKADTKEFVSGAVLDNLIIPQLYDDTADPWGMSKEESLSMGKNPVDFRLMSEEECKKFIASQNDAYPEHVVEDGVVMKSVENFFVQEDNKAVVEYRRYSGADFIDLKVTAEFIGKNKLIKLKIPVPDGVAIGDGPYVVEEKPINNEMSYQKWLGVKTTNGEVFAVINDGVYSGSVKDGYMYITLLRGPAYCAHPLSLDGEGLGRRTVYPTDRYIPRIDNGRYVYRFRIMKGTMDEVCRMAELFNQKLYAINVFPIGTGEKKVLVKTDKPVCMPVAKISEDRGIIFRFFNPEDKEISFNLTVLDSTVKVDLAHDEVVSVRYDEGKFEIYHKEMPV
ncbi:MAG: hypothetical protein IJF76_03200 [Clostridia bacterium]|nr:hypothetical protein [Clostridia bacterium]